MRRALALALLVSCAHRLPPKPPLAEKCRVVAAGSADALPDPWVGCSDEQVEKLSADAASRQLTVQRSERVPGTGYRLLCIDAAPGRPCGDVDPPGKAGDVEVVQPWPDLKERLFVIETVGQPRLDGAWRELARNRLYATGRYRDVTVTLAAEPKDGLRQLFVEIDRLDARPPEDAPCPERPRCPRTCSRREDGCVFCECTVIVGPDISDENAALIRGIVGFVAEFLPRH